MGQSKRDPMDPEIIQTGDTARGPFVEVAIDRGGEEGRFRFAVSAAARTVVDRMLATRPFNTLAGSPYHYYYAGKGGHGWPVTHLLYVRIEHGVEMRTIELDAPLELVDALQWFRQLPSLMMAAALRVPA